MNRTFPPVGAILLDQVLILVFILVGLVFHESMPLVSILTWQGVFQLFGTAFPFMLAGFLAWAGLILKQYYKLLSSGAIVWASVVVLGLIFRVMNGGGVQPTFILTTALFTGILLIGWRLVAGLILRARPAEAV